MKSILRSFIILTCLSAGCNNPTELSDLKNGIVHGTVTDKTTGSPIDDATIYLQSYESGGSVIAPGPTFTVATTSSDASGNFNFDFDYNDNNGYFCSATANLYFDYNEEFTINSNTSGGGINSEVTLQPIAWLNVHIKAVNDYEPSDFIDVGSLYNGPFYGEADTFQIIAVDGNASFQMTWFLFEGGIQTYSQTEDIYCIAFDTTFHEIFF